MLLLIIMTHMNQQNAQRRRRAWVQWPRPQNMGKEHFRVTRETFEYVCDLVRVNVKKQHTRGATLKRGMAE